MKTKFLNDKKLKNKARLSWEKKKGNKSDNEVDSTNRIELG